MEPNDYEVLLVVAGLASYTKLGFAIKPTAWRKFLGGHRFAVAEAQADGRRRHDGGCRDNQPDKRRERGAMRGGGTMRGGGAGNGRRWRRAER